MVLRVQYLGIPFITVCFYLFVRGWDNRSLGYSRRSLLLFLFPVVCVLLANAYPDTGLFFSQLTFAAEPTAHLEIVRWPFFDIFVMYTFHAL